MKPMASDAKWEKEADKSVSNRGHFIGIDENLLTSSTLKGQGAKAPTHSFQRSEAKSSEAGPNPSIPCLTARSVKVSSAEGFPRGSAASRSHRAIFIGVPYDEGEDDWFQTHTQRTVVVSEEAPAEEPVLYAGAEKPIYRVRRPVGFRP